MALDKKSRIIKAFEELDSDMLDFLLNDNQSYQNVPKNIFMEEITRYFNNIKKNNGNKTDFKAYPGACDYCQKGKKGYSFINSDDECYISLVFDESENDFTDIYNCIGFNTFDKKINNKWTGISFYEEDKVDFIPTEKYLRDVKASNNAVKYFENEIKSKGILSSNFFVEWHDNFKFLCNIPDVFYGKKYRFKEKVNVYLTHISFFVKMIKLEKIAKNYFFEFCSFPTIEESKIKDWLIRCDNELSYYRYGFKYDCNFLEGYFDTGKVKIELNSIYYSQSICCILKKYQNWIPVPNPLTEK